MQVCQFSCFYEINSDPVCYY